MSTQDHRRWIGQHDLSFVGSSEVVFHCHHFNLFFDQTIDDALGAERGEALRTEAAHRAFHRLLTGVLLDGSAPTPVARITRAVELFGAMGHGRLQILGDRTGGKANGAPLHYGFGWVEKYGGSVARKHGADAVAAGFAAAALEVAHGLPCGALLSKETACVVEGAKQCEFELTPADRRLSTNGADFDIVTASVPVLPTTRTHEDKIVAIADGLKAFLGGVSGDARGLVEAFGVLVTMHLADYYNFLSNEVVAIAEREKPRAVAACHSLLLESGHACGFHTFGGILASPEWEGLVGAPAEPTDIVVGAMSIARALGFGRWTIEAYTPDEELVVVTPGNYESMYTLTVANRRTRGCSYLLQGGVLATMSLAHRVKWSPRPTLGDDFYRDQMRAVPWTVEETHSVAAGDAVDRVVVRRKDAKAAP